MAEKQYTVKQSFWNDKVGAYARGDVANFDTEMAAELGEYLQEGVHNLSDDANEPMKSSANPDYKDQPITAYGIDANATASVEPTATEQTPAMDTEFATENAAMNTKAATRKATDK